MHGSAVIFHPCVFEYYIRMCVFILHLCAFFVAIGAIWASLSSYFIPCIQCRNSFVLVAVIFPLCIRQKEKKSAFGWCFVSHTSDANKAEASMQKTCTRTHGYRAVIHTHNVENGRLHSHCHSQHIYHGSSSDSDQLIYHKTSRTTIKIQFQKPFS